jgi:hypothetical protein
MKGLGHKASLLTFAAVVALALIGAAYALWFENLDLTASVTTGTLDGSIVCESPAENEVNPFWSTIHVPEKFYPDPGKEVGEIVSSQSIDPQTFEITVSGAYPGYMIDCETHLTNTGTVPWHIEWEQIVVQLDSTVIETSTCDPLNQFSQGFCYVGTPDPFNPDADPIYVKFPDFRGCQVHTDNDKTGSLFIGVNQSAQEATTYTVLMRFRVVQWNESDFIDCGHLLPGHTAPVPDFPSALLKGFGSSLTATDPQPSLTV